MGLNLESGMCNELHLLNDTLRIIKNITISKEWLLRNEGALDNNLSLLRLKNCITDISGSNYFSDLYTVERAIKKRLSEVENEQ